MNCYPEKEADTKPPMIALEYKNISNIFIV